MCKNYLEMDFRHFVIDQAGNTFASARVSSTGRIANFIIRDSGVRQQSGDGWYSIEPESAQLIRSRAESAYGLVPVYHSSSLVA